MDVEAYLASKGHRARRAGAELIYACFFVCAEPEDSHKRKLYVNTETGMFDCKVCGEHGGSTLLMRHFGDEPVFDTIEAAPLVINRRKEVLGHVASLGEAWLSSDDDALTYLLGPKRNLTPETIVDFRFGYVPDGVSITDQLLSYGRQDFLDSGLIHRESGNDFFRSQILIPYIEAGRVVQVRGKDMTGRYYTGPGESVHLYNVDALRGATDVIVVEGEFDTAILQTILRASPEAKIAAIAVVGLAGANAFPDDFDYYLRDAERVYLGQDPDDPGRKSAEKAKERLGPRARVLNWPQSLLERAINDGLELKDIDWTTWIGQYGCTWQDVATMLREGTRRRLSTVAEAGVAFRTRPTSGGLRLGFAELDAWIAPGLLPGQVMIPMAKTGTGKTVWLCNVAYNLRAKHVLFVTLEMTREEIYERLARIHRFYLPFATDGDVDFALRDILICDENRLAEKDFADLVGEFEDTMGNKPALVVVDYLGYYARGAKGATQYERVTDAVMQLKAEAKTHRLVVICPTQVNRGAEEGKPLNLDDARDSGAIEETGDFLISIYRPDDALNQQNLAGVPSGRLRMEILKSRHGNKDRVTTLQMGLLSLVITDAASPDARRAQEENWEHHKGTTYDNYLRDITAPVQMPFRADFA